MTPQLWMLIRNADNTLLVDEPVSFTVTITDPRSALLLLGQLTGCPDQTNLVEDFIVQPLIKALMDKFDIEESKRPERDESSLDLSELMGRMLNDS